MPFSDLTCLQEAIYSLLSNDPKIISEVGSAVYDAIPSLQDLPESYIQIGDEVSKNMSSITHSSSETIFRVSVYTKSAGFKKAKRISSCVAQIMKAENIVLSNQKIVGLWPMRTQSYRAENGKLHIIRLWFKTLTDTTQTIEV